MVLSLLQRVIPSSPVRRTSPARVPDGVRVYAIGDIHGCARLLDALVRMIVEDARNATVRQKLLVFLGDYVDRGPDSRGVLDRLSGPPPAGFGTIFLRGNHEQAMLDFMAAPEENDRWLDFGGDATLLSYGIRAQSMTPVAAAAALEEALPARHRSFLQHLRLNVTIGDYFFVHAGVRPGVPLDAQSKDDMLWIRGDFLRSGKDFGKIVVHGHTICPAPEELSNRINVDTGAYASKRLSCVVLEGETRRFLNT